VVKREFARGVSIDDSGNLSANGVVVSNIGSSVIVRTDAIGTLEDVIIGTDLSFTGTTLNNPVGGYLISTNAILVTAIGTKITAPSSTDNRVARFDGAGGALQNSGLLLEDDGDLTWTNSFSLRPDGPDGFGVYSDAQADFLVRVDADGGGNAAVEVNTYGSGSLQLKGAIRYEDNLLLPSSQLTNYTINCKVSEYTVNATNHVHFSTVTGAEAFYKFFPGVTLTNNSGSPANLTFDASMVPFASTYTNLVQSGVAVKVLFEVEGGNVRFMVSR